MRAHRLIFLITLILTAAGAAAQKGLEVNPILRGEALHDQQARVTTITSDQALARYGLDIYRSVAVDHPDEATVSLIEKAVRHDGGKALSREVQLRDSRLFYGFYRLPPHKGANRYLFYLNQGKAPDNKIILIFMQGRASAEQIKKMLKQ